MRESANLLTQVFTACELETQGLLTVLCTEAYAVFHRPVPGFCKSLAVVAGGPKDQIPDDRFSTEL